MCAAPGLYIVVADNQAGTAENAKRCGWGETWDWRIDTDMTALSNTVQTMWQAQTKLHSMHNKLIFDSNKSSVPNLHHHIDGYLQRENR